MRNARRSRPRNGGACILAPETPLESILGAFCGGFLRGFLPEDAEGDEGADPEGREDAKEDGVRVRQLSTSTGNGAHGQPPRGLPRRGIRRGSPGSRSPSFIS